MSDQLQKKIMRRIYYAYAIRTLSDPLLLKGFFMLGIMIVLTHFVALGSVISNILQIRVGELDRYFINALLNTEAWTLLLLGILIMTGLSLPLRRLSLRPLPRSVRA